MNLNDIVNILTIFQLLLLSSFLLFSPKSNKGSNRFLALFFIVQSTCVLNSIIWRYFPWSVENIPDIIYVPQILLILWGPAFFFYVKSMTESEFRLRNKDAFHFIPILIYTAVMIFYYFRHPVSIKQELLAQGTVLPLSVSHSIFILSQAVNVSYITASLFCLRQYTSGLKEYYSAIEKINLLWLRFVIYGFSMLWLIEIFEYTLFTLSGNQTFLIHLAYPTVFVLACYTAFRGWTTPELFRIDNKKPKYQKYPLEEFQKASYAAQLQTTMDSAKPFMDPELTLGKLADLSGIPERYLSQLLNESVGHNFYDYVNGFRIRAAMHHLEHSLKGERTVLEILYEVGFNSKTAFNVAFKKATGMTPTQFKKARSIHEAV